jgi:glycosyltransferase involved in cell wall biosynthesis
MSKITAVILTKNEENMIADCIDSVSFCDEVIVIDSNSTDRTFDIAKKMNAKVYETDLADFAKRRELGMIKAKSNWILYVDADERVSSSLRENIQFQIFPIKSGSRMENTIGTNVKYQMKSQIVAYRIKRKNFYFGNHEWPQIETLERLFYKKALKGWKGVIHESAVFVGEIGELDGYLLHYTHRDLSSMLVKTIEWSAVEAKLRFDADHPKVVWWRFIRVMLTSFINSYIKQKGYKAGIVGLLESIYQAFSIFITYARLWELQQNKLKVQNEK